MKIALVSLPWHSPYRPSIQIEALAAYLKKNSSFRIDIQTFHDHLEVCRYLSYDNVKKIADGCYSSWLGEALSAYLLFADNRETILEFIRYLMKYDLSGSAIISDFIEPYQRFIEQRSRVYAQGGYKMIGLTVTLCQTFSSILMAKVIKKQNPDCFILMGGAVVSGGSVANSLFDCFPYIDAICAGEGEMPIIEVSEALYRQSPVNDISGIITRSTRRENMNRRQQLGSLEELPIIDYFSYFELLNHIPSRDMVEPDVEITVESSRGCWWNRCMFCNLHFQWDGYREKSVQHHIKEVEYLLRSYGISRFIFVDNILCKDQNKIKDQFAALNENFPGVLDIYLESSVNMSPDIWKYLSEAGVSYCQLGVESLSNSVLKKIKKGTSVMNIILAMKNLEKYQIRNPGNIIYDLPFMTDLELQENIDNISCVEAYYPLSLVKFFLNYGSPYYELIYRDTDLADKNYLAWDVLLPPEMRKRFFSPQREYQMIENENPYLQSLQSRCQEWQDNYFAMKSSGVKYLLEVKNSANIDTPVVIVDYRKGFRKEYRLSAIEANIYSFFDQVAAVDDCYKAFPEIDPKVMHEIMEYFISEKLAFKENNKILSLAINSSTS